MKQSIVRILLVAGLLLGAVSLSYTAEGAGVALKKSIQLTAGQASTVDLGHAVADLLVANPAIADVGTLRASRLYIVGKTVGDTNVLAFDDQGNQLADIGVHVRVDEDNLSETMKKFFPEENVKVRTVKNDIILTGKVSNPAVANQVRDLAGRFVSAQGQSIVDLMTVAGEQQVMLKVKVIEAKRSVLREYGIETDYKASNTAQSGARFNSTGGQTGLTSLVPFATGSIFFDDNGGFGPLKVGLAALEKNGLVNTLAEPNLTAISGETAGFLAGGEFPVPTGRDSNGNITIEFKQFGVSLNFTPTVLSKERIALQLSTEVSTKSADDGVTLVDTEIPGLSVRRAETTVEMGSGGTIMIAGLLKSDDIDSMQGTPGVQELPIIGELFKSKSFSRSESELIILVTPYLVEPYARAEAVRVSDQRVLPDVAMPAADVPAVDGSAPLKDDEKAATPPKPFEPLPMKEQQGMYDRRPSATVQKASYQPLSKSFIDNLKGVYGNKAPSEVTSGRSFGYIVD